MILHYDKITEIIHSNLFLCFKFYLVLHDTRRLWTVRTQNFHLQKGNRRKTFRRCSENTAFWIKRCDTLFFRSLEFDLGNGRARLRDYESHLNLPS